MYLAFILTGQCILPNRRSYLAWTLRKFRFTWWLNNMTSIWRHVHRTFIWSAQYRDYVTIELAMPLPTQNKVMPPLSKLSDHDAVPCPHLSKLFVNQTTSCLTTRRQVMPQSAKASWKETKSTCDAKMKVESQYCLRGLAYCQLHASRKLNRCSRAVLTA